MTNLCADPGADLVECKQVHFSALSLLYPMYKAMPHKINFLAKPMVWLIIKGAATVGVSRIASSIGLKF